MNKIKLNNIVAYFTGQFLLALGVVLTVKANYGVAVVTSPSYVLSRYIDTLSFGTLSYLHQGIIILLMLTVVREIRLRYLLTFLSAVLFGYVIDLWTFILANLQLNSPFGRVILLVGAIVTMSFAITNFLLSGFPMLPFDIFVRKISVKYGIRFSRAKLVFDLSNLAIAVALSFIFFGKLVGVFWGTFLVGLSLGPVIGIFLKFYGRFVEITGRLPGVFTDEQAPG